MSAMKWSKEQWAAYHRVVNWTQRGTHDSVCHTAVRKMLEHAGIPIEGLTSGQIFNLIDDIGYAIRRGAIRVLNEELNDPDSGDF